MFLEWNDLSFIGFIVLVCIFFLPYYFIRYKDAHKSEKKIKADLAKKDYKYTYKLQFSCVFNTRNIKELDSLIGRDRRVYPVFDSKSKIVTVYATEEIDIKAIRNLLVKIGYSVEIVK